MGSRALSVEPNLSPHAVTCDSCECNTLETWSSDRFNMVLIWRFDRFAPLAARIILLRSLRFFAAAL